MECKKCGHKNQRGWNFCCECRTALKPREVIDTILLHEQEQREQIIQEGYSMCLSN